jgi:hypothetical protein
MREKSCVRHEVGGGWRGGLEGRFGGAGWEGAGSERNLGVAVGRTCPTYWARRSESEWVGVGRRESKRVDVSLDNHEFSRDGDGLSTIEG